MSAKPQIKVKLWRVRLDKKIREMERLTGKSRAELVLSAADHFVRAAGKETPMTKQKKRGVERSTNKRDWILWCSPRTRVKPANAVSHIYKFNKYKIFVFRQKNFAVASEKIKFRGIGKMSWWVALKAIRYRGASVPRGYNQALASKAQNYSVVSKKMNVFGRAMVQVANKVHGISRYGAIAYAKALRSTAKWMNANLNRIKKEMKQKFNTR